MDDFFLKADQNLFKSPPTEIPPSDFFHNEFDFRYAAVLVGIVDQPSPEIILTKRPEHMKKHAGQIAFPGGKVEESDPSLAHAAMREAHEEINLEKKFIDVVGYSDFYTVGTGFHICPVVARINPGFDLKPDQGEVAEIFHVPLDFLMDVTNYKVETRNWQGRDFNYYVVEYKHYYIWGATASMLRNMAIKLYGE